MRRSPLAAERRRSVAPRGRPPLPPWMRRPIFFLSVFLFAALGVAPAGAGTLDMASIREQVLPSGLRVVVRESHAAGLVSLQYWVRAGIFREDEESAGTAHFIEHLLFKGTTTRPQGEIDAEIEDLGGVLEAETDKDWTTFRVTVATPFWQKALGILADMVQNPLFRLQDMEAERRVILNEIAAGRAEPMRVLMNSLFQYAFPESPYRFPTTGTPQNVMQLKLGPLREYFRRNYTPANSVLIVVGDVTPEQVFQQAGSLFKRVSTSLEAQGKERKHARAKVKDSSRKRARLYRDAKRRERSENGKSSNDQFRVFALSRFTDAARPTSASRRDNAFDFPVFALSRQSVSPAGRQAPPDPPSSRRHILPSPFRGVYYGVAFPAPSVRDVPDVYAMDVVVTLLQHGRTGRLPARLEPIVRAVQADYQTLRGPGILTVMAGIAPERLEETEKAVLEEIGKLRAAPPPAAEVAATQSILAGAYALDCETFAGQGKALGYYAAIDRWQFASTYLDEIAKVTPAQVHAAVLKYLDPERAVTVILQPGGEVQE